MGQCVLGVDQRVQYLVVVRGGEIEQFADSLFLGSGVLPPLPFQGEDLLVAFAERRVAAGFRCEVRQGKARGLRRHRIRCWFCHGTLLRRLLGKMSYSHVTGE